MQRYFKDREKVIELLEQKGFKHYIPRLSEYMNGWHTKYKSYYIETNENDMIVFCSVVAIENDCIYAEHIFYDCDRPHDFYTKEEGELNYKERLEIEEFLY